MIFPPSQTILRRGASHSRIAANGGTQTVVSSGANANGLFIRTLCLGSGTNSADFRINGQIIFFLFNTVPLSLILPHFFVPAGQAVEYASGAAGQGEIDITWDAL